MAVDILLLAAHPDLAQSRVTRTLLDAARARAGERIEVRDLYRLYPDYAIDVPAEQQALAQARLVVLLHPLQWYSMPGLQKLWMDDVLRYGWAYGPGGQALLGKDFWLATSTGGTAESYSESGAHGHAIETFLLGCERSARLCGMRWQAPLILHAAHRASDEEVAQHALRFVQRLLDYPGWADPAPPEPAPQTPLDARPALFSPLTRS